MPVGSAISPPEAFDSSNAAGRSSLTIRLACELYDEPQRLCPARVRAHLWPWHQLQNLHSIRENRDERRNADTRTREPMQSSRRAGPRCRETQGLARRSDGSNRTRPSGRVRVGVVKLLRAWGGCLGVIRKVSVEGCEMPGEAAERASIPGYSRKPRELKHLSTWWKRNQQRLPQ